VRLKSHAGAASNTIPFTVLGGKLIPVTFTVRKAAPTHPGDYIFLTGNTVELGNWGTTFQTAVGPMLAPKRPDWFLNVSLPAGQTVEFKFIDIRSNGSIQWEGGVNHTFTIPASGTTAVDVTWQPWQIPGLSARIHSVLCVPLRIPCRRTTFGGLN
jgi:hypothetical protein